MVNIQLNNITLTGVLVFFLLSLSTQAQGQVRSEMKEDRSQFILKKAIPKGPDSLMLFQDGIPQPYYVIQLARFERMEDIPELFPKGTTLWLNPDHRAEAILITSSFFTSFEEAQRVAFQLREEGFPGAFARPKPFLVRYR
jgi:hypothetical protein